MPGDAGQARAVDVAEPADVIHHLRAVQPFVADLRDGGVVEMLHRRLREKRRDADGASKRKSRKHTSHGDILSGRFSLEGFLVLSGEPVVVSSRDALQTLWQNGMGCIGDWLRHVGDGGMDGQRGSKSRWTRSIAPWRSAATSSTPHGLTAMDTASSCSAQLLKRHSGTRLYSATKIPPKNRRWPARPEYTLDDVYPPDYIREYTEKSLANIGVSTIDLQQFHVWSDTWADDERWQRAGRS